MARALVTSSQARWQTPRRRWLAPALGVCALALLPACTTGLVYNRMDWVVSWYVNGLVDLDEAQEAELRRMVDRTMSWHRQTQLPKYVALAEELAASADRPLSTAEVEARYQQVSGYLDEFMQHVIPDAAPLLRTLSASQLAELRDSLEEDNQDLWEDYAGATRDQRRGRRLKTTVRVLQRFVGRLSTGQRATVESDLTGMNDVSEQWLGRRRFWQEEFLRLLGSPLPEAEFASALQHMALDPNQFDSADYRRQVDHNRRIVTAMFADLSGGLSASQQRHLQRKFLEYAEDLHKISAAP